MVAKQNSLSNTRNSTDSENPENSRDISPKLSVATEANREIAEIKKKLRAGTPVPTAIFEYKNKCYDAIPRRITTKHTKHHEVITERIEHLDGPPTIHTGKLSVEDITVEDSNPPEPKNDIKHQRAQAKKLLNHGQSTNERKSSGKDSDDLMRFQKLPAKPMTKGKTIPTKDRDKPYKVEWRPSIQMRLSFNPNKVYNLGQSGSGIYCKGQIQDFHKIREQYMSHGILFEDLQFPAASSSLYHKPPKKSRVVNWLRPTEMCSNPKFFVGPITRFDVVQGALGNCGFLSAVAALILKQQLFVQVVPFDQSFEVKYAGIFHFRFFQFGRWIDIVIDDKLPVDKDGNLVYLKSKIKNEFWSALLEKAYAKLCGCYAALDTGSAKESLEDFTGGIAEHINPENQDESEIMKYMKQSFERGALITCGSGDDKVENEDAEDSDYLSRPEYVTPKGIVLGHAYSVTKLDYVQFKSSQTPLLRLLNPLGDVEWNGSWSNGAPQWKHVAEKEKNRLGIGHTRDGEFWMGLKDILDNMNEITVCNLHPMKTDFVKWEVSMFEGSWVKNVSAGGCINFIETFADNPQYIIKLEKPDKGSDRCVVVMNLMQKDRRTHEFESKNLSIAPSIYLISDDTPRPLSTRFFKQNLPYWGDSVYTDLRSVTHSALLEPGTYCIIPSTYEQNEEGDFLLRVFTERKNYMEEYEPPLGIIEKTKCFCFSPSAQTKRLSSLPNVDNGSKIPRFSTKSLPRMSSGTIPDAFAPTKPGIPVTPKPPPYTPVTPPSPAVPGAPKPTPPTPGAVPDAFAPTKPGGSPGVPVTPKPPPVAPVAPPSPGIPVTPKPPPSTPVTPPSPAVPGVPKPTPPTPVTPVTPPSPIVPATPKPLPVAPVTPTPPSPVVPATPKPPPVAPPSPVVVVPGTPKPTPATPDTPSTPVLVIPGSPKPSPATPVTPVPPPSPPVPGTPKIIPATPVKPVLPPSPEVPATPKPSPASPGTPKGRRHSSPNAIAPGDPKRRHLRTPSLPISPMRPQEDTYTPTEPLPEQYDSTHDEEIEKEPDLMEDMFGEDAEIDWKQLKELLSNVFFDGDSSKFGDDLCRSMLAQRDIDFSGKLCDTEVMDLVNDLNEWMGSFFANDKSKLNSLDGHQLREALTSCGFALNSNIIKLIFFRYGTSENRIDLTGFIMVAVKLKNMFEIFQNKDVDDSKEISMQLEEFVDMAMYT